MLFQINKEWLKKGISKLKNTLAKDSPNPVTKHYLFDIKNKVLTIKSTNNALSSIWVTPLDCEKDMAFTIPGDIFTSLLTTLENDIVFFEYFPESKDVKISCGKYSWDASSGTIEDFPRVEIPNDLEEIKLPSNFHELLKSVSFSISGDMTKIDLSSMCIDINKDKLGQINLLSTDRTRLSCATMFLDIPKKEHFQFIIPKSSLSEIMKFEPTKLMYDKDLRKAYFYEEDPSGTYVLQTVLANAVYPDIYTYLNGTFGSDAESIKLQKSDLIRALKRTLITSDRSIGKFTFTKGNLTISTLNEINTSKSKEYLEAGYTGDAEISFKINVNFLLDYLSQETLDVISFKLINNKCLIFDKENYRHVLSVNN